MSGGGGGEQLSTEQASKPQSKRSTMPTATAESQAASAAAEAMGWMPVCDSTGRSPRTLVAAATGRYKERGAERASLEELTTRKSGPET